MARKPTDSEGKIKDTLRRRGSRLHFAGSRVASLRKRNQEFAIGRTHFR